MKRFLAPIALLLCACVVFAGTVRAQELTQADRDKAVQYLETTKKSVLDATKDLTPAQWNFKPAPDRWSIAKCMEHIAAAEDFIRSMVVEKVMIAPAAPGRDVVKIDEASSPTFRTVPTKCRLLSRSSQRTVSARLRVPSSTLLRAACRRKTS